jgi:hypothetical protein
MIERRTFLRFLGLAPVAAVLPAVAALPVELNAYRMRGLGGPPRFPLCATDSDGIPLFGVATIDGRPQIVVRSDVIKDPRIRRALSEDFDLPCDVEG